MVKNKLFSIHQSNSGIKFLKGKELIANITVHFISVIILFTNTAFWAGKQLLLLKIVNVWKLGKKLPKDALYGQNILSNIRLQTAHVLRNYVKNTSSQNNKKCGGKVKTE